MIDALSPGFLVAAPALSDPAFRRSVVLLVEHAEAGSLGFVVNEPAPVSFEQVAEVLSIEVKTSRRPPVMVGGPVAPHVGWIVYDPEGVDEGHADEAVRVSEHLSVSASRRLLESIMLGEGPTRAMLALGYAGWGAGQLDAELARGIWMPVDLDDEIIFETPHEHRWAAALAAAGIDPARIAAGSFSA